MYMYLQSDWLVWKQRLLAQPRGCSIVNGPHLNVLSGDETILFKCANPWADPLHYKVVKVNSRSINVDNELTTSATNDDSNISRLWIIIGSSLGSVHTCNPAYENLYLFAWLSAKTLPLIRSFTFIVFAILCICSWVSTSLYMYYFLYPYRNYSAPSCCPTLTIIELTSVSFDEQYLELACGCWPLSSGFTILENVSNKFTFSVNMWTTCRLTHTHTHSHIGSGGLSYYWSCRDR